MFVLAFWLALLEEQRRMSPWDMRLSLSKNPRGFGGRNAVRKGRAASARGAFLALPCSLGFRLAPPATGGARLCPPEALIGFGGMYGKSAKSLA